MVRSIREKKWYWLLHGIFALLPLILLAGEAIFVICVSIFNPNGLVDAILKIIAPACAELCFSLLDRFVDDYLKTIERDTELKEIKKELSEIGPTITNFSNELKKEIEKIGPIVTSLSDEIRNFNNASIEVLLQHEDFYYKLTKCRLCAAREVLLTQLDPNPPESYENESTRKSYFASDIDYAKSHPLVTIKRILSIETKEKMEWVRELIEATKDLPNLFLAFVNIENIAKETPFPKMLSLQIIDRNEVFVLNPQYSFMPKSYKPCFYIKNKEVAQIFADYHADIWRELERDFENNEFKHGCILKEGRAYYPERLDEICKMRGWCTEEVNSMADNNNQGS